MELRQALAAMARYLAAHQLPRERTLLLLDGQYGTGAMLSDLAGFAFVTRGKEYAALDHPLVQARLHLPPISPSSAQEARSCAASTPVQKCRWGPKAYPVVWWQQPIQSARRRRHRRDQEKGAPDGLRQEGLAYVGVAQLRQFVQDDRSKSRPVRSKQRVESSKSATQAAKGHGAVLSALPTLLAR